MENKKYTIEQMADFVVKEIEKANIKKWDLYLLDKYVYGVYFHHDNVVRSLEREFYSNTHNLSYFIRVFNDNVENNTMGIGMVNLNLANPVLIQTALSNAKSIAKMTTNKKNPYYELVSPGLTYPSPKTYDEDVWDNPFGFLEEEADFLQQRLQENVDVTTTFGKFRVHKVRKMLVNHNGFKKIKRSTNYCYEFSFKAQDGMNRVAEYWPMGFIKSKEQLQFNSYISEWASRTRDALKAKKPEPSPSIAVIMPARIIRDLLLNTLQNVVSGKRQYEKSGIFNPGEQVVGDRLTLIDDGLIEGGMNTSAWDSEGYPKKRNIVIENGIMKNFLYDNKFASLMATKSTGNAQRDPKQGGVMGIEFNNIVIQPGKRGLKEIVGECRDKTLFMNKFSWLNPNPITGDFSGGIKHAYFIEKGQLGTPIKGGVVVGNIYEMLKNIEAISKESRVVMNAKIPYIKFKSVKLL